MTEIGKARKGMIAVAVVILKSVARRLMGTRGSSSGVMVVAGLCGLWYKEARFATT